MNKNEIEVGGRYEAKAGSRWIGVTILGPAKTGWNAVSDMGKPVKVKDVRHLRPAPAQDEATQRAPEAPQEAIPPQADPEPAEVAQAVKRAAKAKAKVAKPAPAKEPAVDAPPARMTCLDAAAAVLKAAGQPMQTKAMIDAMHTQGLWSSDAPTPAATLYSAILREMKVKGTSSRFKKTARGHFDLNG